MSQFLSMRQQLRRRLGIRDQPPQEHDDEPRQPQQQVIGGEVRQPLPLNQAPQQQQPGEQNVTWDYFESAFAGRIRSGVIGNLGLLDIKSFMNEAKPLFVREISKVLSEHSSIKVNANFAADFSVMKDDGEVTEQKYFSTENGAIYSSTNLEEWFVTHIQQPIEAEMEDFQQTGSGWTLNYILRLFININKLNQLRGSSYIELPKPIKNKHACINVENETDHACFKWSVLSAFHPSHNSDRVESYKPFEHELDFIGIEFPVVLKDVPKFEKQNSISVNVYMLKKYGNDYRVSPTHLTSRKQDRHVNLLLIQDRYIDENEKDELDDFDEIYNYRYVWVKNMSALIRKEKTKHNSKIHICDRCMNFFYEEERLKKHEVQCSEVNQCRVTLPCSKKEKIEFKNNSNQERAPFIIYADFECLLEPIEGHDRFLQKHKAHSIGFYFCCSYDPSLSRYESYRQKSGLEQTPAEWFIDRLDEVKTQVENVFKNIKPMQLTVDEIRDFYRAANCHICKKPFKTGDVRCKDHDHLTGR